MKKFEHFKSNLKVLVTAENEDLSNEFIVGGIIDKFFVQFELGWKVLKELLSYEGQSIICNVGCTARSFENKWSRNTIAAVRKTTEIGSYTSP